MALSSIILFLLAFTRSPKHGDLGMFYFLGGAITAALAINSVAIFFVGKEVGGDKSEDY